jgi:hypothetical protein
MTDKPAPTTREERLAAKLRENLRRRKAQARTLADSAGDRPPSRLREGSGGGLSGPELDDRSSPSLSREREGNHLSKPPPAR